uniref:Uncharacterized protein n=1 Tax=Cucumis melo TaxID=3656 RepID=A0A9I9EIM3_CUCME
MCKPVVEHQRLPKHLNPFHQDHHLIPSLSLMVSFNDDHFCCYRSHLYAPLPPPRKKYYEVSNSGQESFCEVNIVVQKKITRSNLQVVVVHPISLLVVRMQVAAGFLSTSCKPNSCRCRSSPKIPIGFPSSGRVSVFLLWEYFRVSAKSFDITTLGAISKSNA